MSDNITHKELAERYEVLCARMVGSLQDMLTSRPHAKILTIDDWIERWTDRLAELRAIEVEDSQPQQSTMEAGSMKLKPSIEARLAELRCDVDTLMDDVKGIAASLECVHGRILLQNHTNMPSSNQSVL